MIARVTQNTLRSNLHHSGVVLLRALPRAGRTSLLSALVAEMNDGSAVISAEDLVCLSHQEIQTAFSGKTLCVDAIEGAQVARVGSIIRSCVEQQRSAPKFILVGRNAKTDQSLGSALIGIMTDLELTPIQVMEHLNDSKPLMNTLGPSSTTAPQAQSTNASVWSKEALWLRGGLPESLNADSDEQSFNWRSDYLTSLLNQDFDCWSIDASDRLPEVFQFVANNNGEQFDDANCANTLSVKRDSVRKSLNLLERTGLLRRLQNWPVGSNQSLDSMPVFYVRDCGLLHAALGIRSMEDLRSHDAIGHSWESFAIEAIVNASSGNATPAFYRKEQNEIDLVLSFHSGHTFAIEFKVNEAVKAKKGFAIGCSRIGATDAMVVHAGEADHSLDGGVSRLTLVSALRSIPQ